ncbi:hypothetical protein HPP92_001471 [Vanilla planifolia]|uniref:EF-hand domain-containing protein n=1 Tax=Vanilla planifolia TaxID=51239 RepID=A0A835VI05_VANPL|nr:hypothetical protein HPP92_001471 [Vanilla planifolia]
MENASEIMPIRRGMSGPSPSFRLRSKSSNTLRLRRALDIFDHNRDAITRRVCPPSTASPPPTDPVRSSHPPSPPISAPASTAWTSDFEGLHRALGDSLFGTVSADDPDPSAAADEAEESDMEEAFRVFDEDGDGYISAAELQAVLAKLGLPEARSISSVRNMICSVDQNRDGRVDFLEFKHMMRGITVRSGPQSIPKQHGIDKHAFGSSAAQHRHVKQSWKGSSPATCPSPALASNTALYSTAAAGRYPTVAEEELSLACAVNITPA